MPQLQQTVTNSLSVFSDNQLLKEEAKSLKLELDSESRPVESNVFFFFFCQSCYRTNDKMFTEVKKTIEFFMKVEKQQNVGPKYKLMDQLPRYFLLIREWIKFDKAGVVSYLLEPDSLLFLANLAFHG